MARACNPSSLGGRGKRLQRRAQAGQLDDSVRPHLKILKRAENVALWGGPELNTQYHKANDTERNKKANN